MDQDSIITDELVLRTLLKDKGVNAKLVNWKHESGTAFGNNFFNVVKRIKVRYVESNLEKEISYVAKINPCKPNDDFNPYRLRAMKKEVFFYETLHPLLCAELSNMGEKELRVPKYFTSSTEEGKEVIFFEDLCLKGFETFDRKNVMDEAHAKIMANELARLHTAAIALQNNHLEDLGTKFPLLIESWYCPEINLRDAFAKVFQKGMLFNISLTKGLGKYQDIVPWLEKLSEEGMETIKKEMDANPPWRGICHGDYHLTNVMFKYDEARNPIDIMVVDWQTVRMSHMASELGYFAYSSFNWSLRKQYISIAANTYIEKFKQILGSKTFFNVEQLLKETDSNQFGILLCFYVIPLSLCVSDPAELFSVEKDELEKYTSEDADMKAKVFLQNVPHLSAVLIDFLEELKRKKMHVTQ